MIATTPSLVNGPQIWSVLYGYLGCRVARTIFKLVVALVLVVIVLLRVIGKVVCLS